MIRIVFLVLAISVSVSFAKSVRDLKQPEIDAIKKQCLSESLPKNECDGIIQFIAELCGEDLLCVYELLNDEDKSSLNKKREFALNDNLTLETAGKLNAFCAIFDPDCKFFVQNVRRSCNNNKSCIDGIIDNLERRKRR